MSTSPRQASIAQTTSSAAGQGAGEPEAPDGAGGDGRAGIEGERGIPSVNRIRSMQSRVTTVFAIALMGAIGAGLLGWYYSRALTRHQRITHTAQTASAQKAKGEMTLPPLGHFTPPRTVAATPVPSRSPTAEAPKDDAVFGSRPPIPPELLTPTAAPVTTPPTGGVPTAGAQSGQPAQKSPADLAFERRLSGPVFSTTAASGPGFSGMAGGGGSSRSDTSRGDNLTALATALSAAQTNSAASAEAGTGGASTPVDPMNALLKPTITPAVLAGVLPTQRFLLPKGAFIDCTLETAIDSTLPGLTTCVTATDVFGADGTTVLLERGSKLTGETRGEVRQGAARIFVLWTEARTPTGVVIGLASPGTDELGRSGLPGDVDRHFFERFGAAMLITLLEGTVEAAAARPSGNSVVVLNPTTSAQIPAEVLRSTINIPPTVRKQNGDRIQVLVARDLDFRSVYELRPTAAVPR